MSTIAAARRPVVDVVLRWRTPRHPPIRGDRGSLRRAPIFGGVL
jgi:hypothetical protein